jgi:hypothetical protein
LEDLVEDGRTMEGVRKGADGTRVWLLDPEDEGIKFIRNVGSCLPIYTAETGVPPLTVGNLRTVCDQTFCFIFTGKDMRCG